MANIQNELNNIKSAIYGKDVRNSIHDGIDAINNEVESTTGRQVDLENTFDQLIINAGNSNAEIVDARVKNDGTSYSKLGDRLDAVDSQLEQKINYITPQMYKDINTEDDTDSIIEAINQASNGEKIVFSGKYIIDKTITLDKDVVLDFTGSSVYSNTSSNMFNITNGNVKINGLNIDLKNKVSKTIFDINNSNYTNITNCSFKNFKEVNSEIQLTIVKINSGSNVTLNNINFENITNVGNSVITDQGGASRLILTQGEQNEKRYCININNIYINNVKTINSEGIAIKEDADSIVTQHKDLLGNINISNVIANNFGKRIIKIQGSNVNINNVHGSNTSGLSTDGFIYVNNDNVNISNIKYYSNCDDVGISISNANNCNISNVIIENVNSNINNNSDLKSSILCVSSSNINICSLTSSGFSRCVTLYDCVGINIRDSKISSKHKLGAFICRTLSDYKAPNCKIKNILFSNCKFIVEGSSSLPFVEMKGDDTSSELKNITIENCLIDFQDKGYQYGYFLCNSVKDFIIKNSQIKYNTDIEATTILSLQGSSITEIYKTKINSSNDINVTKDILIAGNSKGYIERSDIKEILISSNATVEIDKSDSNVTLTSGATTSSYKIYSHYVKQ